MLCVVDFNSINATRNWKWMKCNDIGFLELFGTNYYFIEFSELEAMP
jgi:hypothetical protein